MSWGEATRKDARLRPYLQSELPRPYAPRIIEMIRYDKLRQQCCQSFYWQLYYS